MKPKFWFSEFGTFLGQFLLLAYSIEIGQMLYTNADREEFKLLCDMETVKSIMYSSGGFRLIHSSMFTLYDKKKLIIPSFVISETQNEDSMSHK